MLQDKLAQHASELIGAGLSGVKELVDTLVRLDGVGKGDGDDGETNEARLQKFLRKSEEEEVFQ